MENFWRMLGVQGTLFVYMAVGYGLRKLHMITDEARKGLSDLLLYVLLPCMIFASFQNGLPLEKLISGGLMLAVSCFICLVAWALGKLLWRRYPPERAVILRYGTLIANAGFAGMAVVQGAYGEEGVLLASLFIIAIRVLMWSAGVAMFSTAKNEHAMRDVLLNPGILATAAGLVWGLLYLPTPAFLGTAITRLGDCTAPLSLVMVGAILADVELRGVFERDALLASAVRLLLMPAIVVAIMKPLGFPELHIVIAAVLTGMPIGSTTAILAQKYGADARFGSQCVFVSTVGSLFTVPLLTLLVRM